MRDFDQVYVLPNPALLQPRPASQNVRQRDPGQPRAQLALRLRIDLVEKAAQQLLAQFTLPERAEEVIKVNVAPLPEALAQIELQQRLQLPQRERVGAADL